MGRPPSCEQEKGLKKGPWTPEEDIVLVSYVQEHGPGNWRSVPTNTGLLRCSKSCRLRWTNYLRPGIKRGNFTTHEEGMIFHLQALLGNKWAAIASYLPQRTDNDIKNYWNTHLKKKLKKLQSGAVATVVRDHDPGSKATTSRGHFNDEDDDDDRKSLQATRRMSPPTSSSAASRGGNKLAHSSSMAYASSTENISRLLEGWLGSSPKTNPNISKNNSDDDDNRNNSYIPAKVKSNSPGPAEDFMFPLYGQNAEEVYDKGDMMGHEELESMLGLEDANNVVCCESIQRDSDRKALIDKAKDVESMQPLSFIEKWLLDETAAAGQVEEMMGLPSLFL